jgi:hypothetical protein
MIITKNCDVNPSLHFSIIPGDILLINRHTLSNTFVADKQKDYFMYFVLSYERVQNTTWNTHPHIMISKMIALSLDNGPRCSLRELKFFDSEIRDSKFIIIRK